MLLRGSVKKGELFRLDRESNQPTSYTAYVKHYCMYLLASREYKLERNNTNFIKNLDIIFLRSFFASKVEGIPGYSFGLELINEGCELTTQYFFYSKNEKDIDEWIACINNYSEYSTWCCILLLDALKFLNVSRYKNALELAGTPPSIVA